MLRTAQRHNGRFAEAKPGDELVDRGVDVGEIRDVGGGVKYAALADPDGITSPLEEMAWRN